MKIYGFSHKDAGRIKGTVDHHEGYYRTQNPTPPRAKYPGAAGPGGLIDFQNGGSQISAGSFSSPASGSVTLLVPATGAAMTATGGTTVTAYNQWGTAVAASKFGKGHYRNGYFYIVVWDC
jgi:hypothetical protein